MGYRWGHSEDTVRLEAALRAGLASRGSPRVAYLANGSAMVSSQLLRALAILGITLTHSQPGQPAGRGKIERFFRTVREQFLVELAVPGALAAVGDLARLNELFAGWVETVYHARVHSETGQRPLERFLAAGPPTLPTAQMLHEAFLWSQPRTVTKTATISLHGNRYEVDAALVGRRVEVVFDPFDLATLEVRYQGRSMGIAVPHRIATSTPTPAPTSPRRRPPRPGSTTLRWSPPNTAPNSPPGSTTPTCPPANPPRATGSATASIRASKPSWPPSPRSATSSPTANCPANST